MRMMQQSFGSFGARKRAPTVAPTARPFIGLLLPVRPPPYLPVPRFALRVQGVDGRPATRRRQPLALQRQQPPPVLEGWQGTWVSVRGTSSLDPNMEGRSRARGEAKPYSQSLEEHCTLGTTNFRSGSALCPRLRCCTHRHALLQLPPPLQVDVAAEFVQLGRALLVQQSLGGHS